jgi:Kef-type K+ transport system membrane component KefB
MEYTFLLYLALILFSTKVLGVISKKCNLPQVVGALIAGIIIGPSVLNLIQLSSDAGFIITDLAELGVIFLMFSAGLETDLTELKKNCLPATIVAAIGVFVPIACGFAAYVMVYHPSLATQQELLKAIFIGVILSATSVSITVETLREMGKLSGRVGTTILGAAVIDDILGIIVLTIVTSLMDTSVSLVSVLLKIVLYFLCIGAIFFVTTKASRFIESLGRGKTTAIMSLVFCLGLSYASETFFGIADITGAYFAGLILCNLKIRPHLEAKTSTIADLFLSPIFFVSIGLKTSLSGMDNSVLLFSAALLVAAFLSKVVGCGLGARLCGFSNRESLQIGVGMISRGEVALIVAQKGFQYGLISETLFAPVVLVVIITTLVTPILLKLVMKEHTETRKVSIDFKHRVNA